MLHLDAHLHWLIDHFGVWIYAILFLVLFCETGLVVTPFLPGDTLLFTLGTMAAAGFFDIKKLYWMLMLAVLCGDNLNYWIGRWIGPKIFDRQDGLLFKREYLDKTHAFYGRHGARAIILARFIPIIRTFAPFVAGIGTMHYGKFFGYSLLGVLTWLSSIMLGGYFFGNYPFVKNHFEIFVLGIAAVSMAPVIFEGLKIVLKKKV